jgi:hypothetical protein
MKPDEINRLLQSGKKAAKNSDPAQARELLLAVIEADEKNEEAWLWLSSVVESGEDRRICLENVLVINPENAHAKRGLTQLDGETSAAEEMNEEFTIRRQYDPVSPAASILYPGQNIREWRWREPVIQQQATNPGFQGQSSFDDVWELDVDICPYCAGELAYDDWRCSDCRHNLKQTHYRYPKPSSDLLIFLVLIVGVAQLSFILILMNLAVGKSLVALIWQTLIFITMISLATGIHFRRFWSYLGSIIALLMVLITIIIELFVQSEVPGALDAALADGFFKALAENPYLFSLEPFIDLVIPFQLLAVVLALFYAIFRVGPDFERVLVRQTAQIDKGVDGASMFYTHGKDYAGRGMWATAVLHFRRAAALEPTRSYHLVALGDGYARLGYYQRSLDVLESALQLVIDVQKREELANQISEVRQLQGASLQSGETNGFELDNG